MAGPGGAGSSTREESGADPVSKGPKVSQMLSMHGAGGPCVDATGGPDREPSFGEDAKSGRPGFPGFMSKAGDKLAYPTSADLMASKPGSEPRTSSATTDQPSPTFEMSNKQAYPGSAEAGSYGRTTDMPGFISESGDKLAYPTSADLTGSAAPKTGRTSGPQPGYVAQAVNRLTGTGNTNNGNTVGQTVGQTVNSVGQTLGQTANTVGQTVGQTANKLGEMANLTENTDTASGTEGLSGLVSKAGDSSDTAARGSERQPAFASNAGDKLAHPTSAEVVGSGQPRTGASGMDTPSGPGIGEEAAGKLRQWTASAHEDVPTKGPSTGRPAGECQWACGWAWLATACDPVQPVNRSLDHLNAVVHVMSTSYSQLWHASTVYRQDGLVSCNMVGPPYRQQGGRAGDDGEHNYTGDCGTK